MMELLKRLCVASPSGREDQVREVIRREVEPYCDEITTDVMGNLIAHKKGEGPVLMLSAHMDEIGLIATVVDEKGFVRFAPVGGHEVASLINQQVRFPSGVQGVVHYDEKVKLGDCKLKDCYIDIGVRSREEAEELVQVGDMAVFHRGIEECGPVLIGRGLDDKAGCWLAIQALRRVRGCRYDLYCVFTVQEEVGLRGARTAAYGLQPDVALALDVTDTGDVMGCDPMAVELHKGAAIKLKDGGLITHPRVKQWLCTAAREAGVATQLEILTAGSTDAGAISLSRGGVLCGGISVPTRYIHSANEMVSKADLESCAQLLTAALERDL
ncbi:MAG: M42 family metallopeptidase [Eubacteriales bacterium]|jgi:putative aminopeptidase FrvX